MNNSSVDDNSLFGVEGGSGKKDKTSDCWLILK